jgi:hypothetical protein
MNRRTGKPCILNGISLELLLNNLMNLSRDSIIPVLHDFERSEYIEISCGAIQVRNIAGLQETIARDA